MPGSARSVEFSVRVYEMLVKAYPASFRREYGDEMTLVFREQMRDAWRERGAAGVAMAWFRVLGDLACTAPEEHFHELQRRIAMKSAAMGVLSVVLATIAYVALYWGTMLVAWMPLALIAPHPIRKVAMYVIMYLSAFLTGLLLTRLRVTRARPFFMPAATVPLGIIGIWLIWAGFVLHDEGPAWLAPTWGMVIVRLVTLAFLGLAALLGSIVATKAASRLSRLSIPWFQLVGSLAMLICTSVVLSVLRLTVDACHLSGNQMEPDLQRAWGFCLFAMLVIGAVTIANMVLLFVRSYRASDGPTIGHAKPCDELTALP
jgi:hypothetical protein